MLVQAARKHERAGMLECWNVKGGYGPVEDLLNPCRAVLPPQWEVLGELQFHQKEFSFTFFDVESRLFIQSHGPVVSGSDFQPYSGKTLFPGIADTAVQ